jgi:AraC-like DNA-binding protein
MPSDPRFGDRSISSVALHVGFGYLSYFDRAFRRRYGATPSEAICLAPDRDIRCSMPAPPARGGTSVDGTKHNCLGAHGISGAEGRPAAPSTWRRKPTMTHKRRY